RHRLADRRLLTRIEAPLVEVEAVSEDGNLDLDLVRQRLLPPELVSENPVVGALQLDRSAAADSHVAPGRVGHALHGLRHRDRDDTPDAVPLQRTLDDIAALAGPLDRSALKDHPRVLLDVEETRAL